MSGYLASLDWAAIAGYGLVLGVGVLIGFLIATIMAMGGRLADFEEWSGYHAPDHAPDLTDNARIADLEAELAVARAESAAAWAKADRNYELAVDAWAKAGEKEIVSR